jgi:micrococcal nuclease
LVEHGTENAGVGSSILPLATAFALLLFSSCAAHPPTATLPPPLADSPAPSSSVTEAPPVIRPASTASSARMPRPPSSAKRAHVVRVSDGDTVALDGIDIGEVQRSTGGHRARLIGIDTPEVYGEQECYGEQASAFTKRELDGEDVLVDFDVDTVDRYGRALVYIWQTDGRFFNGRLAAEGYASQSTFPPNVRYVELFSSLVREAREQHRGLWAADC